MRKLTPLQRSLLIRRLERDVLWSRVSASERVYANSLASSLVDGLQWAGVHGASEKRAVELIVSRLEDEATA